MSPTSAGTRRASEAASPPPTKQMYISECEYDLRKEAAMQYADGIVTDIVGVVLTLSFPSGAVPAIYDSVTIPRAGGEPLVAEVQQHLGYGKVKAVAMDTTDGLRRNTPAFATGAPIAVPVGSTTLGRVFNVLGRPIDNAAPIPDTVARAPIHRAAPVLAEQV